MLCFLTLLVFSTLFDSSWSILNNVEIESGENVTLQCNSFGFNECEWIRKGITITEQNTEQFWINAEIGVNSCEIYLKSVSYLDEGIWTCIPTNDEIGMIGPKDQYNIIIKKIEEISFFEENNTSEVGFQN